jgi:hypothetical protein
MAKELAVHVSTPVVGTYPSGGWRSSVIDVSQQFVARCNCGWVDDRRYLTLDGANNRASKHSLLHDEGLVGITFAWPSLQDNSWLKNIVTLLKW